MKCDSCNKEANIGDKWNYVGGVSGSSWSASKQISIYDHRSMINNVVFYSTKYCDLIGEPLTYCEDCCNRRCAKKCIDCIAIKRDNRLNELGI